MKRIILLAVLLTGITLNSHAQDPIFNKGDVVANIGIGLTNYANLCVSVEKCVADEIFDKGSIGVGLYGGAGISYRGNRARFVGGVRGTFHYPILEKFDTYIGMGGGLSYTLWFTSSDSVWPDIDGFLGARYQYNEKTSLYCEFGASLGYINAGISVKLK